MAIINDQIVGGGDLIGGIDVGGGIIDGGTPPPTTSRRMATINYANGVLSSYVKSPITLDSDKCITKAEAKNMYYLNEDVLVDYSDDNLIPRALLEGRYPATYYDRGFHYTTLTTEKITGINMIVIGGHFNGFSYTGCNKSAKFSPSNLTYQGDANLIVEYAGTNFNPNYGNISIIKQVGSIVLVGMSYYADENDKLTIYNTSLTPQRGYFLETDSAVKVYDIQQMLDGKILVGGKFTGVAGQTQFGGLIKLNADGTYVSSENSSRGALDGYIKCICVGSDGSSIYVGGVINGMGRYPATGIVKTTTVLGPSRAFSTNCNIAGDGDYDEFGEYYDVIINAIVEMDDGNLLIGGHFKSVSGEGMTNIAILDTSGNLVYNSAFVEGFNGIVNDIIKVDGYYYICGEFTEYCGIPCGGIICLTKDGDIVDSFDIEVGFSYSSDYVTPTSPKRLKYLDKKIFVNGNFSYYGGLPAYSFAVLTKLGKLYAGWPIGADM